MKIYVDVIVQISYSTLHILHPTANIKHITSLLAHIEYYYGLYTWCTIYYTTMRFTVDFEIPLVVDNVVVIRIIKVKYIFTICIYPILLWWNPSHSLALHFTHSKWSILFYIFMSFNQPRQLYSTNPYDTGMRENVECMIMVYNVQQWKRWWWEVQEGYGWMDGWMEIKRSIAYIQLYWSTKMNFIFDASFFYDAPST